MTIVTRLFIGFFSALLVFGCSTEEEAGQNQSQTSGLPEFIGELKDESSPLRREIQCRADYWKFVNMQPEESLEFVNCMCQGINLDSTLETDLNNPYRSKCAEANQQHKEKFGEQNNTLKNNYNQLGCVLSGLSNCPKKMDKHDEKKSTTTDRDTKEGKSSL